VDASNHPILARLGGSSGGALLTEASCTTISNGVIAGGFKVPDTALTIPLNVCVRVTITDSNQNGKPFYTAPCAQPASTGQSWCTAGSCNFDLYAPALSPLQVQYPQGPPGPPGSGLTDPGTNGVIKRTALNTTAPAAYADVVALWASCSGYLKNDGTCLRPGWSAVIFLSQPMTALTLPVYTAPAGTADVITIPANCSTSTFGGVANAASTTTFTVAKNGTAICAGTITGGSSTLNWASGYSQTTLVGGDRLTVFYGGDTALTGSLQINATH
jgi:hypothetical protein